MVYGHPGRAARPNLRGWTVAGEKWVAFTPTGKTNDAKAFV